MEVTVGESSRRVGSDSKDSDLIAPTWSDAKVLQFLGAVTRSDLAERRRGAASACFEAAESAPVGVVERGDDESFATLGEMLNEIVSEGCSALGHAAPKAPIYLLAARVVSALERVL